jgi:hypothetical protein
MMLETQTYNPIRPDQLSPVEFDTSDFDLDELLNETAALVEEIGSTSIVLDIKRPLSGEAEKKNKPAGQPSLWIDMHSIEQLIRTKQAGFDSMVVDAQRAQEYMRAAHMHGAGCADEAGSKINSMTQTYGSAPTVSQLPTLQPTSSVPVGGSFQVSGGAHSHESHEHDHWTCCDQEVHGTICPKCRKRKA